jgi:glucose dehydrogenase/mono/diheme cytochrome c family protein
MVYDPDLDLLYIGTGNGSPWSRYARSPGGGDNLFLCAILALKPDTGELVWHYQTTPGDNWDYTSVQQLMLADLQIGDRMRKVIMQAPKNGFFYMLDRATGELLSAEPYVTMNWATHVDKETGRPVETDTSNYKDKAQLIFPGPQGGHSWHPMAFSPDTGLVYIPAMDIQFWYPNDPEFEQRRGEWALGLDIDKMVGLTEEQEPEASGFLIAWDPIAQKEVWRVSHEGYWNGGALATAGGLVFQGAGDGRFAAYDDRTGEKLWGVVSQTAIMAAPVTYEIDGEQYIAVAAGWGGGVIATGRVEEAIITDFHNENRVIAFKLGATKPIPMSTPRDQTVPTPPALTASAGEIAQGKSVYNRYCMACHGFAAASSLIVPDLRYMSAERHEAFEDIVVRGIFQGNGMPPFEGYLKPEEIAPLYGYIVAESQKAYDEQLKAQE